MKIEDRSHEIKFDDGLDDEKNDTVSNSTSLSCSVAFDIDDAVVMSNRLLSKLDGTDEGLRTVRASVRDTIMMAYKLGYEHGATERF